MKTFAVALSISALLALSTSTSAQEKSPDLKLSETMSIAVPQGWVLGQKDANSYQIYVPLAKERPLTKVEKEPGENEAESPKPNFVIASEAGMQVIVERRRSHAEAVRRLAEIASEYPERVNFLTIAGWPAVERRYSTFMPQPGEAVRPEDVVKTTFATTAVAVDASVVQFNTMLAPDADPKLIDQALAAARALRAPQGVEKTSQAELAEVRRLTRAPLGGPGARSNPQRGGASAPPATGRKEAGVSVQVQTGVGELEVASNDGQHVAMGANSGFSFSDNFGATWTFGGGTPCNQTVCDGDPSLSVGASGAIYYAWIGGPTLSSLGDGVSRSTDNGHTYAFRGLAATCPGTTSCTVADQEHIAADRVNAASGGGDRVYSVWRDFAPTFSIRVSCSTDGGATWTAGAAIGAGDLPRVSVGGDGSVYAAWPSGGNMMLHKFSTCDSGLVPQVGWPVVVSPFVNVACPVPGLDRCNGRNILSSPKVAVDDLDPNHLYYVFATSTGVGNEDVMVFDSTDGGATFPRSARVNAAVTARRFMPWISSYGGIASVSWYDRRTATAANNDLTRYMLGGVAVKGASLIPLAEIDLSGASDNECSTWPAATNAVTDSESCSVQPQRAGRCFVTLGPPPVGSGAACDFSTPACTAGETCFNGRGAPKYGDYNGNAVGAGLAYSAWSSSVPPAGVGGASGTIRVYASAARIPSDFYVRDWNAGATFDNGAQPSTNPVFWHTSDVWNQSAAAVEAAGPDGSIVGDPPSRAGSNFVFARVSRRAKAASTAPPAVVTVNFFYGDYGLGSGFVPIGSETVTLAPGDMTQITPAHAWSVPAGASSHLCLAVQITGPDGDNFTMPSVAGIAPGPADPFIVADNNKAQRNLQDTIGTAAGTELIALVANAGKVRRAMALRVSLPKDGALDGEISVLGGRRSKLVDDARLDLGVLAPGERRWVRLSAANLANVKTPIAVDVFEDTKPPANGFTVRLRGAPFAEVARRNLLDLAGVLGRIAEVERLAEAKPAAGAARRAADRGDGAYIEFFVANREALAAIVAKHLRRMPGADGFEVAAAAKDLAGAVDKKDADQIARAVNALIERLDAQITEALRRSGRSVTLR